jgi:hypothetical protein
LFLLIKSWQRPTNNDKKTNRNIQTYCPSSVQDKQHWSFLEIIKLKFQSREKSVSTIACLLNNFLPRDSSQFGFRIHLLSFGTYPGCFPLLIKIQYEDWLYPNIFIKAGRKKFFPSPCLNVKPIFLAFSSVSHPSTLKVT